MAEFGQMGVQLFFVASAYTLCLALDRRHSEPKPIISFYVRRFFRIAPLYYLAIILYYAVAIERDRSSATSYMPLINYDAINISLNVLFLHSLYPAANNSIVPGGWSIATEMMFYAVFPTIYAQVCRAHNASRHGILIVMFVCFAASVTWQALSLNTWSTGSLKNSFIYFSLPSQIPVFMAGISAYLWKKENPAEKRSLPFMVIGALCTAISIYLWSSDWRYSFAIIPTLCSFTFVCLLFLLAKWRPKISWMAKIGKVSYSMYIFHFIVVWGMNKYLSGIRSTLDIDANMVLIAYVMVASAITYLIASFSEKFLERPGINLGNRIVRAMQQGTGRTTSQGTT